MNILQRSKGPSRHYEVFSQDNKKARYTGIHKNLFAELIRVFSF